MTPPTADLLEAELQAEYADLLPPTLIARTVASAVALRGRAEAAAVARADLEALAEASLRRASADAKA